MAARAAVTTLPTEPAGGDPPTLRQYPLYSYLVAARLTRQLALALPAAGDTTLPGLPIDDAITAFLAQEQDRPVARALRREWLSSLAERRLWSRFLENYDASRDPSIALQCQAFAARIALGRIDGLQAAVAETWLAPRSLPDECDAAFDWWAARGGPGPEMTERRARLALQQGETSLARHLAKSIPGSSSSPLLQWAALIERPATEIPALIAHPERPVEIAALLDGWQRYARSDAEAAAETYPRLVAARGARSGHCQSICACGRAGPVVEPFAGSAGVLQTGGSGRFRRTCARVARTRGALGRRLVPDGHGRGGDAGSLAHAAALALLVGTCERATR